MTRTIFLTSAHTPDEAARAVAEAYPPVDLAIVAPSALAHEAAAVALGGRWVATVEEPLLAARSPHESGNDAIWRLARALRVVHAHSAQTPLVVCDGLDVFGAGAFALDEQHLLRVADDLERLAAA